MDNTNAPSPKRPSPPPAAASTASGVTKIRSLEINDDDIDLQLQLRKFNPSAAPNDNRLPPPPMKRKTTASSSSEERHDGYDWRKYGQKEILNSKYPRHYFCCTHRHDKGCLATKQVQRVSEDPPLYRTTYFRKHPCNQSSFSSSSISYVSQAADEHTQEHSIVFEKLLDEDDLQPCVLIGFEQQPEEHTQQHSMEHEPSSLSSSISYVAQPRGIVKHTQQHGTAHEFVQQSNEGVVTDVVKEPTLHVSGLCSTSLPSPTSTSKEEADSVISELTTTTADPAEFADITPGVGFYGNLSAKLEAERGIKFEHSDLDADIDELYCNAKKEFEMLPQDLKPLTLHCSLFPANYEFEKDTLVQLWIAGDFLWNMQTQDLEASGKYCFDYLLKKKFVVPSRFDHICGDLKYKINPAVASVLEKAYTGAEYLLIEDWKLENISEKLQHLSLACEDLQIGIFDALKKKQPLADTAFVISLWLQN